MNTENKSLPDHELAREELDALFDKCFPYKGQNIKILGGEIRTESKWLHRAYEIKIYGETFHWKRGIGIKDKPSVAEVLAHYCAEYLAAKDATFHEWCENFGYETDSITVKEIYDTCQAHGIKLRQLPPFHRDHSLIAKFAELAQRL